MAWCSDAGKIIIIIIIIVIIIIKISSENVLDFISR
jgi:hypothetical protein